MFLADTDIFKKGGPRVLNPWPLAPQTRDHQWDLVGLGLMRISVLLDCSIHSSQTNDLCMESCTDHKKVSKFNVLL